MNHNASNQSDIIVALRTHMWNPAVATLAAKLHAATPGAELVILADETREHLNTAPFEKITHTNDFSQSGLPNFPPNQVLWYNGDYPLYALRTARPHAAYYAMVEYDVAVNLNLTSIIRTAQAQHLDLITSTVQPASPEWYWICTGRNFFPTPWRSFLPVIIVSGRGIDHMLKRRREIWQGRILEIFEDWPFCETFIPSVIDELGPNNMADLSAYAGLPHFTLNDALHINDPTTHMPGTISHPVYGDALFAIRQLVKHPILSVFEPGSALRRCLIFCAPADFLPVLAREISKLNDDEARARFEALIIAENWSGKFYWNIAYNKPALQSSTDSASKHQNPADDARGGNNGVINGHYNFHTGAETDPWWQVDLQANHWVHEVVLYNRLDLPERSRNLSLSLSQNGHNWSLAAVKLDNRLFGGADGRPFRWRFAKPLSARFVRVTLIGELHFHLDEIEIYGEPA